jgi:hypothetical protein
MLAEAMNAKRTAIIRHSGHSRQASETRTKTLAHRSEPILLKAGQAASLGKSHMHVSAVPFFHMPACMYKHMR